MPKAIRPDHKPIGLNLQKRCNLYWYKYCDTYSCDEQESSTNMYVAPAGALVGVCTQSNQKQIVGFSAFTRASVLRTLSVLCGAV